MLSSEDNELLCRVGRGTPMGDLLRHYWMPCLPAAELPAPDCPPKRVRLLGEDLVAFRDSDGQVGLLPRNCPHRGASLFFGRNEECGLRCSTTAGSTTSTGALRGHAERAGGVAPSRTRCARARIRAGTSTA